MNPDKKTILLNGATGGLGNAIAHFLNQEGHNLVLTGRNKPESGFPEGENILFVPADVRNEDEIIHVVKTAIVRFGKVDVLINAAGVPGSGMSWKLTANDWNETLAVNLSSPFFFMREVLPSMRAQQFGRIINLSSLLAYKGLAGTAAYAASKAGLDGLVRSIAAENAAKHITVNNIALGYFDAGMLYDVPENVRNQVKEEIPMGNFGHPDNITALINWLISDKADYITGQTIQINGGLYS